MIQKNFLLIAFLFFSLLTVSCIHSEDPISKKYPKKVKIEYRITSSVIKKIDLDYTNDTGGTTEIESTSLPFSKSIEKTVEFAEIISLTGVSEEKGDLKLEILVDSKVIESKTFEGSSLLIGTVSHQFD